jgi:hypothetical protein
MLLDWMKWEQFLWSCCRLCAQSFDTSKETIALLLAYVLKAQFIIASQIQCKEPILFSVHCFAAFSCFISFIILLELHWILFGNKYRK